MPFLNVSKNNCACMVLGSTAGDLIEVEVMLLAISRNYAYWKRPRQAAQLKKIARSVRLLNETWQTADIERTHS
jgi:hypothetical protein